MSQFSKLSNTKTAGSKQDTQVDSRLNKRLKDMPIAIVGMASIFANSRYLNKFWDLISEKIDAITELPSTHWQPEEYYDANKSTPDKSYCKRGGFLPDVDFNPMEFGLPPNILELTDTSQLLSLIVAKEVLADANLAEGYDRDKIGITLGVGGGQKISHSLTARLQYPVLKKVFANSGISDTDSEMLIKKFQDQYVHWEENSFPGSLGNVIAGRIANRFDFGGMNCVVDAACAGSLAAMRMALSELAEGRSEMMITGGVCTDNSPSMYMSFSKTPAFTTNETIQPFDIDSKGMMIGEGIGMIALKRLEDAERDGDRIYCVIKGIGSSSDGKFKSIYAPRPEGQAKALNRAYDDAGFAPHTLGLIEAHGTGTAAGDAAEFAGLCSVFRDANDTKQHIALGSIKSQIGHTKSTAGTAGLIKAALALHHKVLPATINISEPSPKLDIENSPFYLNTETRPWLPRADGTPRRAGISSFGFGGTNFHFVLEEYTNEHNRADGEKAKYRQRQVAQSFLVSAASKDALINELNTLTASTTQAEFNLKDAAANYALRKLDANSPRIGLVVNTSDELATAIKQAVAKLTSSDDDLAVNMSWQLPGGTSYRAAAIVDASDQESGKLAALFAGQGSQYLNMGRDLACYYPEMRQQFVSADKVFAANNKTPLSQTLYPKPVFNKDDLKAQEAVLTNTANAQSAIGAISMGQYELFTAAGFNADMVAGHSFGELSALCAAGVISSDDYYKLAFVRGHAMATKAEPKAGESEANSQQDSGAMYAIITKDPADLATLESTIAKFDGVKVANYNAPTQSVIAGPTVSTAEAAKALSELGYKAINLPVSAAFHTELVGHAQAPFAKAIDAAKFTKPSRALYSNATGAIYDNSGAKIKASFKQHMLQSVRFTTELEAMYDAGARVFVEFGPKNILQKLVQGTLGDKALANKSEICTISINPSPKGDSDLQLKQAAVQLAVAGVALDNIDPYQADIAAPAKASPMNITLNAANYISKATRAKMAKSLATGTVTSLTPKVERIVEEKIVEVIVEKRVEVEKIVEKIVEVAVSQPNNEQATSNVVNVKPVQESLVVSQNTKPSNVVQASSALSNFFASQQQNAELHQEFLKIPQQYGETFTTLMIEQTKLAGKGIAIPESLQRSMEQFHQLQAQTLQSHTQFLEMQAGSNIAALNLLNDTPTQAYAPAIQSAPIVPTASITAPVAAPVQTVPTAVTPQAQVPQVSHQAAPTQTTIAQAKVDPVAQVQVPAGLSAVKVKATMMSVVAEKTGYPTEMLELEMDMEADLGIDSIKRVEILGTVQDELPGLPELNPEDLAECRTLGEIVALFTKEIGNSKLTNSAAAALNVSAADSLPLQDAEGSLSDAEGSLSAQKVQATMLKVVADKTGYPTEMLELEMDMEADLGIDSIKRVEILGTVQDELPGLPELSPEDLAECRTLGEIVTYMNSKLPEGSKLLATESTVTSAAASLNVSGLSAEKVQATMMSVVADKTGYPTEMLELSMDMEADLGIDSIKRVEILGTVQEELPGLPELNPEDLAECRTLGEIVSYMNSKLTNANTAASATAGPAVTSTVAAATDAVKSVTNTITSSFELPPHSEVMLKKLNAADQIKDCFAADATLVIADDGHNAGVLAEKLTKQGLHVAVVRLPEDSAQLPLNSDVASFQAKSADEAGIAAVIGQIEQQLGKIGGFIHLQPEANPDSQRDAINLSDNSFNHVSQAFLWAKLLQPKLVQPKLTLDSTGRHCFITVSRIDGGFGYLDTKQLQNAELNQAALAGLTKTLSHEWPMVFCRALDIAANLDATHLADAITSELFDSVTNLPEVGLSLDAKGNLARTTLVAGKASTKHATSELNNTDTVLVTGGAKGVTFECALALASRTQSHFILAGRSELLAVPTWAENKLVSELKSAAIAHIIATGQKPTPKQVDALVWPVQSSIEINAALEAFTNVGASADYVSMDVTDTAAITAALAGKDKQITGLIHGAGVLADKHIQDKTLSELARVYGTKVNGLKAVLATLDASKLKLLAMFSSAAGFYGNTGQSDYAMSNDILNKAALQFTARNPQAKVMSFNWGPWDGGMVNPALKKMFTDRGVYVIPLKAGADLFATQLLSETGVQLLVGTSMQGGGDSQPKDAEGSSTKNAEGSSTKNAEGSREASVKKLNAGEVQTASRPLAPVKLTPIPLTLLSLRRKLNPNTLVFIQDHRIGGNPVLPTVCAIQWMREAASEMLGSRVKVIDYKLLKGIIFKNDDVQEMTLELTPIEEPSASFENNEPSASFENNEPSAALRMSALISCQGRPQYKAILISDEGTKQPDAKQFTALGKPVASASELYSNGTLFHGPRLQGIKQVFNFDDSGLIASCQLPQVSDTDCGQFVAQSHLGGSQPFAEDLLLQAMLVWARLKYGAASLPSTIGEFVSNKPMAFGDKGILELEVVKASSRSLQANIALYHENGELSTIMNGAKVTISKSLNDTFLTQPTAVLSKESEAK